MTNITGVASQADFMLAQCASFIECVPTETFARESDRVRGGTIGKHVRHTLDHYRAILDGFEQSAVVDYDHRRRNVPIESDRRLALEAVAEIRQRIRMLDADALSARVRIRVMLAADGSEAELDSTLARELAFASHHAIHHNALMKAIAAEFEIDTPPEFGVAPSTLNFQTQG
ncbi:MAG: hypothetical protein Kow0022_13080 [Phycisphaerales bacterium]